jgi:hypothetical protein
LRDGHQPPPRLLLPMMLALYQSVGGRANAALACWWLPYAIHKERRRGAGRNSCAGIQSRGPS